MGSQRELNTARQLVLSKNNALPFLWSVSQLNQLNIRLPCANVKATETTRKIALTVAFDTDSAVNRIDDKFVQIIIRISATNKWYNFTLKM
ncbi:hypothetical protein NQ317_019420 [Molorchus minor]|uniref:Uncharacterized protein n=1 Tax=Molorchus minor TaxID=1323400 RepID=A0ABQ9JGF1_9CUCU|nr:hypothetical protein NQ317_019420 [Molorchus minor]